MGHDGPTRAGPLLALMLILVQCASTEFYGQSIRGPSALQTKVTQTITVTQQTRIPPPQLLNTTQQTAAAQQLPKAPAQGTAPQQESTLAVVKASNDFARELYQALRAEPGNLVVSPLSVAAVLALAWLGSGGRTAQQLVAALHLPQDAQQVMRGYKNLFESLQLKDQRLRLDVANHVFVRSGQALRESFQRGSSDFFHTGAVEVDFARPTEAAAVINNWVRQQTQGKIQGLVDPAALPANTMLLLANAVYFKGTWRTQFDPTRTVLKPFRTGEDAAAAPARNVSLMWTTGNFPFARLPRLDAQAVRLPYVGDRVSMLVVLPNAVDGLPRLEEALAAMDVKDLLAGLNTEEVYVWLPRFAVRSSLTLNDALVQLGLSDLFGSSADFSGIASQGGFLSRVLQKASIEVNEEGSEAAAATGGIFLLSAGLYNFFRADHPFLFFLLDDQTGTVLFQGRFTNPE